MRARVWVATMLLAAVSAVCSDSSPNEAVADVDALLASVCTRAAQCPGVSASQDDIAACPADLRAELSPDDLAALERITTYATTRQTCILECTGTEICGRFGGGLSSISDSDLMEPLQSCEYQCLP